MSKEIQFLLDNQEEFQNKMGYRFEEMTEEEIAKYIKDQSYWVTEELHEMTRELPFIKSWKDYTHLSPEEKFDMSVRAKEEYIDLIHFIMNIGAALGFSGREIINMYCEKHKINYQRQEDPSLGYVNK